MPHCISLHNNFKVFGTIPGFCFHVLNSSVFNWIILLLFVRDLVLYFFNFVFSQMTLLESTTEESSCAAVLYLLSLVIKKWVNIKKKLKLNSTASLFNQSIKFELKSQFAFGSAVICNFFCTFPCFFRVPTTVLRTKCAESLKCFTEIMETHHENGRASLLMGVSKYTFSHWVFFCSSPLNLGRLLALPAFGNNLIITKLSTKELFQSCLRSILTKNKVNFPALAEK